MTRTREFNSDEALDSALNLFWLKGYQGCSMADVVEDSGVARYGLYQEFGDKDELYRAALGRYRTLIQTQFLSGLQGSDAGLAAIEAQFENFLTMARQGNRKGCLACQAAIERAGEDAEVAAIVRRIFGDMKSGYRNALRNALAVGDVRDLPLESLTEYLFGLQRTIAMMARSNSTYKEIRTYAHCALELLRP